MVVLVCTVSWCYGAGVLVDVTMEGWFGMGEPIQVNRDGYRRACRDATVEQGLECAVVALAAAAVPVTVDQTGGMTMCVRVAASAERYVYVTRSEIGDGYYVVEYDDRGPDSEGEELHRDAPLWLAVSLCQAFLRRMVAASR